MLLFEFIWLKSLVTKEKLRTKFDTFVVKLRNLILLSIFKEHDLFMLKT